MNPPKPPRDASRPPADVPGAPPGQPGRPGDPGAAAPPPSARTGAAPAPRRRSGRGRARAPGRPGAGGPELRPRLLDAALACYARQGIAATTLRDIASHAEVTPALLHYYFGDGQQLRDAVVAERLLPALGVLQARLATAGPGTAELVRAFVDGVAEVVARHPWLPPLWVREVLSEGGALRALLAERIAPTMVQALAGRLAAARAAGELNPGLDPRLVVVSLIGLTLFPAAGAPIWRRVFEADDIGPEQLRRHTLALLAGGLGLEDLDANP